MALAALAIYLVWAALAFGWRTVVQLRRTGDAGLRLHAERRSAQWWAKIGFVVAIAVGFAAPVTAVGGVDDIDGLDVGWLHLVGVVAALVGVVLTLVAQLAMGSSWRIGVDPRERTGLVSEGPFGVVRNPIFTAMVVATVGLTAMIPNAVAIAGLLALVVALEVQVRLVEEPYLAVTHGDTYRRYAGRVGRFLPGIGRLA